MNYMTVSKLIEYLKEFPGDIPVIISEDREDNIYHPIYDTEPEIRYVEKLKNNIKDVREEGEFYDEEQDVISDLIKTYTKVLLIN